jgi:hypothetical protein
MQLQDLRALKKRQLASTRPAQEKENSGVM